MILFEQAMPPAGKDLNVPQIKQELFIKHMSRAFGQFPLTLGKPELERLEGMAATWQEMWANPYETMIHAIQRYGSIKVWAQYDPVDNPVDSVDK